MKIADLLTREGHASSWQAVNAGGVQCIYHYSTLMVEVSNGEAVQVSEGWGSMTDKCGMAKIRQQAQRLGLEFRKEIRG